jgi:hypothetical protein
MRPVPFCVAWFCWAVVGAVASWRCARPAPPHATLATAWSCCRPAPCSTAPVAPLGRAVCSTPGSWCVGSIGATARCTTCSLPVPVQVQPCLLCNDLQRAKAKAGSSSHQGGDGGGAVFIFVDQPVYDTADGGGGGCPVVAADNASCLCLC